MRKWQKETYPCGKRGPLTLAYLSNEAHATLSIALEKRTGTVPNENNSRIMLDICASGKGKGVCATFCASINALRGGCRVVGVWCRAVGVGCRMVGVGCRV